MSNVTPSDYSRKNPFPSPLKSTQLLTLQGSDKETQHYEFSLAGSGLHYDPGDSLGIFPDNDPELVEGILKALHFEGNESVEVSTGETVSLREALTRHFTITSPPRQLLQAIAESDPSAEFLKEMIDPTQKTSLDQYLWGRDVLDVLLEFPDVRFTPESFIKTLRKLLPRLYSIASSLRVYPDEVHLLAATVRYTSRNRHRGGVCTTYLADRLTSTIPVFVHAAKHFRLPEDTDAPVIMVGPGTGIAPFRAFLQERQAIGAKGRNWLFFGEQHEASGFFYREELECALREGSLTRLDTAFSRDQDYKIYVQHRMLEAADEFWKWLEEGAYFYVCGDAARMARDVDATLHTIIEKSGGKSSEEAKEYVMNLRKEKRYRKDVY